MNIKNNYLVFFCSIKVYFSAILLCWPQLQFECWRDQMQVCLTFLLTKGIHHLVMMYSDLFITQSSFNSISTQDVDDAVDFFGAADMSFGENDLKVTGDLSVLSQESEEMCGYVFDFTSGKTDKSWSVDNDCAPFKVTRNADGKHLLLAVMLVGLKMLLVMELAMLLKFLGNWNMI